MQKHPVAIRLVSVAALATLLTLTRYALSRYRHRGEMSEDALMQRDVERFEGEGGTPAAPPEAEAQSRL